MSIINKISDRLHYYYDSLKFTGINVKIEHFKLNRACDSIDVVYRLGRQKLMNYMALMEFEKKYFDKVSNYDQHRLTKFSTLQYILQSLFSNKLCRKETFTDVIEEYIKNEQLF